MNKPAPFPTLNITFSPNPAESRIAMNGEPISGVKRITLGYDGNRPQVLLDVLPSHLEAVVRAHPTVRLDPTAAEEFVGHELRRRERIAAACHSAWYAYTVLGLGEPGEPWVSAPEWQRQSIRSAVEFWEGQLPALAHLSRPALAEALCPLSHENWTRDKLRDGWTYGEVKDADAKTHPCLVPYEDLPEAQRLKDRVVVECFLAMLDVG